MAPLVITGLSKLRRTEVQGFSVASEVFLVQAFRLQPCPGISFVGMCMVPALQVQGSVSHGFTHTPSSWDVCSLPSQLKFWDHKGVHCESTEWVEKRWSWG